MGENSNLPIVIIATPVPWPHHYIGVNVQMSGLLRWPLGTRFGNGAGRQSNKAGPVDGRTGNQEPFIFIYISLLRTAIVLLAAGYWLVTQSVYQSPSV